MEFNVKNGHGEEKMVRHQKYGVTSKKMTTTLTGRMRESCHPALIQNALVITFPVTNNINRINPPPKQ